MYLIEHSPMEKVYYALLIDNEIINGQLKGSYSRYTCMRPFFEQMFPFSFLKAGDTAIQVGSHDGFIEMGLSQTFIMASIVGPSGHVHVVEPDPKNTAAIRAYIAHNAIDNVSVIEKAVWDSEGDTDLTVFEDFSSTNRVTALDYTTPVKYADRLEALTHVIKVETTTLKSVIHDYIGKTPNFINITINCAEPEAIESLGVYLEEDIFITIPVCNARFYDIRLLDRLRDKGFNIVIGNARSKRMDEPFWVGLLTRRDLSGTPFTREADLSLLPDGSVRIGD